VITIFVLGTAGTALAQEMKEGEELKFEVTELRSAQEYEGTISLAEQLLAANQFHEGLLELVDVVETGDDSEEYYRDAEFLIGVGLFHLGLYQSSYNYFEKVLDAKPRHARYSEVLPWMVALHQKIPGESATLERMAEFEESAYPAELKDEIYFYVGQFHYYQGTLRDSLKALRRVTSKREEYFLRARYLEGVVQVRKRNAKASEKAFKAILQYERDNGTNSAVSDKIYRMALLSLARIFYTIGQYETAIRYYDQIPEYSPDWLESLLEVSWSYFQLKNFGRALGNLHTLNSPYFEEEYYPEALVLEAVILHRNCHYSSALNSIHRFIKSYHPLYKELNQQLKVPRDPNQFYGWLARMSRSGADLTKRLKRIFNAALADRKLNRIFRFILHLNQEIDSLKRLSQNAPMTAFAATLIGEISAFRALVIGDAGALARNRLENVHKELRRQLADALKVKFETLNARKRALKRGLSMTGIAVKSGNPYALDSEHQYWPFDGEYWKDELDSYTVELDRRCPKEKPDSKRKKTRGDSAK
jgi:tetratricopeptide (TPR) repeat protein